MKFDPQKHHRRSIRLQGYDYAGPGGYFVTICTHRRECLFGSDLASSGQAGSLPHKTMIFYCGMGILPVLLIIGARCEFGEIVNHRMCLNQIGHVVVEEWLRSPIIRPEIELDAWVVMPNHIHGIIVITKPGGVYGGTHLQPNGGSPHDVCGMPHRKPRSLSSLIAGFKSTAIKRINVIRNTPGVPVWQRNYHERIIRNEEALHNIRRYIIGNPRHWAKDVEN